MCIHGEAATQAKARLVNFEVREVDGKTTIILDTADKDVLANILDYHHWDEETEEGRLARELYYGL